MTNQRLKRLYFDMEYTGLKKDTTVISIGIVSDDNKTFYAELTDYDKMSCDDWINKNVIGNLILTKDTPTTANDTRIVGTKQEVRREFMRWLDSTYGQDDDNKITVFSDCLAYDWVLFNDLFFDHALNIDSRLYYIPIDLSSLFYSVGEDPDVGREKYAKMDDPKLESRKHNALWDALVIKICVERVDADLLHMYNNS